MSSIIHHIKEDRLKGIGHLFIRSIPFHFLVLAVYVGVRYGLTLIPIPDSFKEEIGIAAASFARSSTGLNTKIGLIILGIILFQIALYTLFSTLYYRINEMIARSTKIELHFVFRSFLSRYSKSLFYNIFVVVVLSLLCYMTFLCVKHSSISMGLKSVVYFFGALILASSIILIYIRQLLTLPNIAHNNQSIFSSLAHSFRSIKTKHAILALFLTIAITFIFYFVLAIIAGALITMQMPKFISFFSYSWQKLIPIIILYVAFYILFYVARSAILLYTTSKNTASEVKADHLSILDHISEEI